MRERWQKTDTRSAGVRTGTAIVKVGTPAGGVTVSPVSWLTARRIGQAVATRTSFPPPRAAGETANSITRSAASRTPPHASSFVRPTATSGGTAACTIICSPGKSVSARSGASGVLSFTAFSSRGSTYSCSAVLNAIAPALTGAWRPGTFVRRARKGSARRSAAEASVRLSRRR